MLRTLTFLAPLSTCPYLPDRTSQLRYEVNPDVEKVEYLRRLETGWRRFGPALFRPECPSCRACLSLRVPVETFRPNQSQRRAWRKNQGAVELRIGAPGLSPEKVALFQRFHGHKERTIGWPHDDGEELHLFVQNPFPTEEWCYYLEGRLVGVGWVDALAGGLSAIYFFHDPVESRRSLGTFNILSMIESARRRGLRYVYLGYYVEGCRSLEYKGRFRPHEVLRGHAWTGATAQEKTL